MNWTAVPLLSVIIHYSFSRGIRFYVFTLSDLYYKSTKDLQKQIIVFVKLIILFVLAASLIEVCLFKALKTLWKYVFPQTKSERCLYTVSRLSGHNLKRPTIGATQLFEILGFLSRARRKKQKQRNSMTASSTFSQLATSQIIGFMIELLQN